MQQKSKGGKMLQGPMIDNSNLEQVTCYKDVTVSITERLSPQHHKSCKVDQVLNLYTFLSPH
jgi:hypothetical protein